MFWLIIGVLTGWYARELRAELKRVTAALKAHRQPDVIEQPKKSMSFGEPVIQGEMTDEELIESLNKM